MNSTSYEKVKFFFHCVRQIAPDFEGFGHYPMDDNTPAPAEAWNAIRDAVKERVRVYRRGGVHQSEDNVVVVETDEEFAYNHKVKKQLEKDEAAGLYIGATWVAIKGDYDSARKGVREAIEDMADAIFQSCGRQLALQRDSRLAYAGSSARRVRRSFAGHIKKDTLWLHR